MASKTQLLPEINSDYLSFNCQDSVKESFLHTKDVLLPMMKVKPNVNNNKKIFSVFVPTGLLIRSSRNNSISWDMKHSTTKSTEAPLKYLNTTKEELSLMFQEKLGLMVLLIISDLIQCGLMTDTLMLLKLKSIKLRKESKPDNKLKENIIMKEFTWTCMTENSKDSQKESHCIHDRFVNYMEQIDINKFHCIIRLF